MIALVCQIVNLDEVKRGHDRFVAENATMLAETHIRAGQHAVEFVRRYPGFKPRTGKLQAATEWKTVRLSSGRLLRITNPKAYASSIDSGARPHVIRPRRKKALRFRGANGGWVFARQVNHPGNRPYKTFYRATFSAYRSLGQDLERGMRRLASRF